VQVVVRHLEARVPVRLEADVEVVERGQAAPLAQRRLQDRERPALLEVLLAIMNSAQTIRRWITQ
jgi:hypothetical protein